MQQQHTIKQPLQFCGLGVHNGLFSSIQLKPAVDGHGIVFRHLNFTDEPLVIGQNVPLLAMHATVLRQKSWILSTVEHLLAALRMSGVDNVLVEVAGDEIPILDGSAAPFVHAIKRSGLNSQGAKKYLMPRVVLDFADAEGRRIILRPHEYELMIGTINCTYEAAFNHYALGVKKITLCVDQQAFNAHVAPARTFGFVEQLPFLRSKNLAMASSLGNTLVFNTDEAINDGRVADEWVRHKILDLIGDISLLPYPFTGLIEAWQTGHAFNRRVVEHYLAHPGDWVIIEQ